MIFICMNGDILWVLSKYLHYNLNMQTNQYVMKSKHEKPIINKMIRLIKQDQKPYGVFVNDLTDHNARWLVKQGVDMVLIDFEHHPFDCNQLRHFLMGMIDRKALAMNGSLELPVTPLVRLPSPGMAEKTVWVKQVLDSGVCGIVFPYIESAEQALSCVESMRYPGKKPITGKHQRGFGPKFATWHWGLDWQVYYDKADVWPLNPEGELLCFCQIESPAGLEHLDDILAVPGVSGIMIGPADYSIANIHALDPGHKMNTDDFELILKKIQSSEKLSMVLVNPNNHAYYKSLGFDCCLAGHDGGLHEDASQVLKQR